MWGKAVALPPATTYDPLLRWASGKTPPPTSVASFPFTSTSKPSQGPFGWTTTLCTSDLKSAANGPRSSSALAWLAIVSASALTVSIYRFSVAGCSEIGVETSSRAASSVSTRNSSCFNSAIRLLGILLGNHVPDHEINVALTLAFDPVRFRLQP